MSLTNVTRQVAQAIFDAVGLQFVASVRVSVDPASVAAEASGDTTVTLTGALPGDVILWGHETAALDSLNAAISVYCSAADTVRLRITNNTVAAGAAIDVAAGAMQFVALRRMR